MLVERAALHRQTVDGNLLASQESTYKITIVLREVHRINHIEIRTYTNVP